MLYRLKGKNIGQNARPASIFQGYTAKFYFYSAPFLIYPAVLCAVAMVAAAVEEAPSELAGASLTVSPSVSDGCALVAAVSGGSVACIALI